MKTRQYTKGTVYLLIPAPVRIRIRCDFLMRSTASEIVLYWGSLSRLRSLIKAHQSKRKVSAKIWWRTGGTLPPEGNRALFAVGDFGVLGTDWTKSLMDDFGLHGKTCTNWMSNASNSRRMGMFCVLTYSSIKAEEPIGGVVRCYS